MSGAAAGTAVTIFTVGQGILTLDEFLELLRHHGIEQVVDVRAVSSSRQNPQFDKKILSPFLRVRRIKYLHLKELGGIRRHARDDSPNGGWRNASLRGFADYMQTAVFKVAINRLIAVAQARNTAIMCVEASPARCHRLLIADALLVRGFSVVHINSDTTVTPHTLTSMAKVDGVQISYPPPS